MQTRLPKYVKIGPFIFSINSRSENWGNEHDCQGLCHTEHHEIDVVIENRTAGFVLDTLIHEVQHAIWWAMDLKEEDKEEEVVHRLATGWSMVYVDNPSFLEFIEECVDEIKGEIHV